MLGECADAVVVPTKSGYTHAVLAHQWLYLNLAGHGGSFFSGVGIHVRPVHGVGGLAFNESEVGFLFGGGGGALSNHTVLVTFDQFLQTFLGCSGVHCGSGAVGFEDAAAPA